MKLFLFAAFPISEVEAAREMTTQQVQKKQEVLLAYSTIGYYKSWKTSELENGLAKFLESRLLRY